MNKNKIVMVLLLLMCIGIGNASAEIYEARIDVYKAVINDTEDIIDWDLKNENLWIGQGETEPVFNGIDITFDEPAHDYSYGSFIIKTEDNPSEWISPDMDDNEVIKDFGIKIELLEIRKQSITSGTIYEDDKVISIWIEPNSADKLGLSEGDIPNVFNPIEYGKTAGWSSAGNTEEVIIHVEKLEDVSGILIEIEGGEWEEIITTNDDKRIFELYDNVEYTITVTYTEEDKWGGENDEVDVYILSISGLESSSSSSVSSSGLLGAYSKEAGSKISVVTSCNGTFNEMSGMSVKPAGQNSDGNYVWELVFDSAGTKRIDFVSNGGGEGYFDFQISAKQDSTESSKIVTVNDDEKDSNLGLILIVLGLVGAVVLVLFNKKGKNKKGSMTSSPEETI